MTNRAKQKILRKLYFFKSIGFEYMSDLNIKTNLNDDTQLPNSLDELNSIVNNCHLCQLSKSRQNILFGDGNYNANILFLGDEPSISEDRIGKLYSGKTGTLLETMIKNVLNIDKRSIYFTNIVKCKSSNANIQNECISSCKPYLLKQIELISPKLIVTLGEKSYFSLTNSIESFDKIRGKILNYKGLDIIPTFSPSFLLRNPSAKKEAYYDMLKIKSMMEKM